MLKIRRPLGRLIFNMGIAIPGKTVFLIEMAPWPIPSFDKFELWFLTTSIYINIYIYKFLTKLCSYRLHFIHIKRNGHDDEYDGDNYDDDDDINVDDMEDNRKPMVSCKTEILT